MVHKYLCEATTLSLLLPNTFCVAGWESGGYILKRNHRQCFACFGENLFERLAAQKPCMTLKVSKSIHQFPGAYILYSHQGIREGAPYNPLERSLQPIPQCPSNRRKPQFPLNFPCSFLSDSPLCPFISHIVTPHIVTPHDMYPFQIFHCFHLIFPYLVPKPSAQNTYLFGKYPIPQALNPIPE